MAFAWISGPAISVCVAVGVGCMSWRLGADAPITTTRPRMRWSGTRPSMRSEKDTVGIVPGGPR